MVMVKTISFDQVKIMAFPMDDRIWRIGWLGQFIRNPKTPSELSIEVTLTPLKEDINPNFINLNNKSSYNYSKTRTVFVGCGLLPILKIGSFWQNGINKTEFDNRYTRLETSLLINTTTSEFTDYKSFPKLFDLSYYVEIEKNMASNLLVVDCPENDKENKFDKLIIPCAEILRFYYARSSQLIRALLNGQLDEKSNDGKKRKEADSNKIYNPDITLSYCNDGIGHIHLRPSIPDKDAPHVARIAFSPYANIQARNIYASGIKNDNNLNQFLVKVRPPFEGETTLVFEGKRVLSPGFSVGWSFLVFQIKSCSHPFPFTQLTFSRDNDGRSTGDNEDKPESWNNAAKIQVKTVKKVEEIKISNEDEPSANLELTDLEVSENAFPDLLNKDISKTEKEKSTHKAAEAKFISAEVGEDFSIGAGTYGKTKFKPVTATRKDVNQSQNKEDKQKRKEALPASFNNFIKIILQLSTFEEISYQYLQINFDNNTPEDEGCSFFPLSINNWVYINSEQSRQRQFMTVEVKYGEHYFYFFEIEAEKPKHESYSMFAIHGSNFNKISENMLRQVIRKCTENYGRWLNDQDFQELYRKRFKHTANSIENCAKKFYNYMKQQLEEVGNTQQKPPTNNPEDQLKDDTESSDNNLNSGKVA